MKITRQDVEHVANLARLRLDEADVDKFVDQIGTIIEYVETLNKVDTEEVPPMSHAIAMTNAFREDVAGEHLPNDQALANAPQKEDGLFVVPRVIG